MMKGYTVYLKLEIKRAFRMLPYLLAGAIMLSLVISIIAFCASKILYEEGETDRIQIGVVTDSTDKVNQMAMSYIESMDSLKDICSFQYLSEETALGQLEAGTLNVVIIMPDQMVQGIMDGSNTPAIIILPENMGTEASILKELTDAGQKSLGAAQASIYAAYDYFLENDMIKSLGEVEDQINKIYIYQASQRSVLFESVEVSGVGDMTTLQYYMASAGLMFFLFCGIPCSFILKKENRPLKQKMQLVGIKSYHVIGARILSIVIIFTMFLIPFSIIIKTGIMGFLALLPVIFAIVSIIVFSYEITPGSMEGVMLLFVGSLAMILLSGGIIPVSLLPRAVSVISPYIPTTPLFRQIGTVVTGEITFLQTLTVCSIAIIFYGAATAAREAGWKK